MSSRLSRMRPGFSHGTCCKNQHFRLRYVTNLTSSVCTTLTIRLYICIRLQYDAVHMRGARQRLVWFHGHTLETMANTQEPQDFNASVMPSTLVSAQVAKAAAGLKLYDTASHAVSSRSRRSNQAKWACTSAARRCSPRRTSAISAPPWRSTSCAAGSSSVWAIKVTFVRNVTDIDDKILDKAAAAGQQWWERAYYLRTRVQPRRTAKLGRGAADRTSRAPPAT